MKTSIPRSSCPCLAAFQSGFTPCLDSCLAVQNFWFSLELFSVHQGHISQWPQSAPVLVRSGVHAAIWDSIQVCV